MLILKKVERPRELKWYQAGAMLYGDWGTSKAYVLGIAFALAGHSSWFFLGLMSGLTALVGVCYMIICRSYPDGGGVYSSVRQRSQILGVVGALLMVADYVITASLSAIEAFHYFNVPNPELWAIAAILFIGAINWIGPAKGGSVAALIAIVASFAAAVLFLFTLPHLPHVQLSLPEPNLPKDWTVFVGIVLALSGVEAIANMTGIMQEPVEKTARKAIFPVLLEVSVLTFLLGIAMNAIPGLKGHTEDMLRALGNYYIGPWYGQFISIVFGLLLLSAVNTAIGGLVSVQFSLARDRELPPLFAKLNRFGMPWLALITATLIPVLVLLFETNVVGLAALYAIGVVGAITLNLGACATNFNLKLKSQERLLLLAGALILFLIEITIMFQKHNALIFALIILGAGLALRQIAKTVKPVEISADLTKVNVLTLSEAKEIAPLYQGTTLLALKSVSPHLLEEARIRAKALNQNTVYIVFVEPAPTELDLLPEITPSEESLQVLGEAQHRLEERGITAVPIWHMGNDPGKLIARTAQELEVNTVVIGTTKRSAMVNLLRGDVFRSLAHNLPKSCRLVISG